MHGFCGNPTKEVAANQGMKTISESTNVAGGIKDMEDGQEDETEDLSVPSHHDCPVGDKAVEVDVQR